MRLFWLSTRSVRAHNLGGRAEPNFRGWRPVAALKTLLPLRGARNAASEVAGERLLPRFISSRRWSLRIGMMEGRGGSRTAPTPHSGGAEPFDPFRVGQIGMEAIRGRRAQKACPCPRLLKVTLVQNTVRRMTHDLRLRRLLSRNFFFPPVFQGAFFRPRARGACRSLGPCAGAWRIHVLGGGARIRRRHGRPKPDRA
jgi:hypothetical protein